MKLFSVQCTTCRARLRVRDEAAVGQVLACPRCGSMVHVVPPAGWRASQVFRADDDSAGDAASAGAEKAPQQSQQQPPTAAGQQPSSGAASGGMLEEMQLAVAGERYLQRRFLLVAVPSLIVTAAIAYWTLRPGSKPLEQAPVALAVAAEEDDVPADAVDSTFDSRWLPEDTKAVIDLQWDELRAEPAIAVLRSAKLEELVAPLLEALQLPADALERATWGAVDVADWRTRSVLVLTLSDAAQLDWDTAIEHADKLDFELSDAACYRLAAGNGPHAVARTDERHLVTGPEDLMRRLAERQDTRLTSATLAALLTRYQPESPARAWLDLQGFEADPGAVDAAWFWRPLAAHPGWTAVRDLPRGLGLSAELTGERCNLEVVWLCDTPTVAEEFHQALLPWLAALEGEIDAESESLAKRLAEGRVTIADTDSLDFLLTRLARALDDREVTLSEDLVRLKTGVEGDLPRMATAALGHFDELEARWVESARQRDRGNHQQIARGLAGHVTAEGSLPVGAAGAVQLPAEQRLSWIATMLPYYGQREWHRELNFRRPWNDPQNRPVTRRPLDVVVNPLLGSGQTEGGYPTTHYVGVAGVGADAAELDVEDPRAGVFGYRRRVSQAAIADGASNTIAVLGVTKNPGPWSAGGVATVRPLTQAPYVNGPDGFGSGQPDGMLAGMADGSVRFLSRDIDPQVMQQLATIRGGRQVELPSSGPTVPPAASQPTAEAKPPVESSQPDAAPSPLDEERTARRDASDRHQEDVQQRLDAPLVAIDMSDVPLIDVVEFLSRLSTVQITLDLEALAEVGLTADLPVAVQLQETTVGETLTTLLSEVGLGYVIDGNHVVITNLRRQRDTLRQVRYRVDDLTAGDRNALQSLALLVRQLIEPASWQDQGGRGRLELADGSLLVEQHETAHYGILVLCEKLRRARGLPLASRLQPERFALDSRWQRAEEKRLLPVTANFNERTRLTRILAFLQDQTDANLSVDWHSLASVGVFRDVEVPLHAHGEPLEDVLEKLVGSLQLAYRAVDERTFQITTPDMVQSRLELEFYPVADLLDGDQTPEELIERVQGQVAPTTWSDVGGPGAIVFDSPSRCLLVLQSQPVQRRLEDLLDTWRAQRAAAGGIDVGEAAPTP